MFCLEEMLDDELFEAKVLNPDTNTYYQVVDSVIAYRKFSVEKKYPIKRCAPDSQNKET